MKCRISALVFDMGGVLTRPQDPAKVRAIMDILGLDGDVERFKAVYFAYRDEYDRGTVEVADYWRTIASELGAKLPDSRLPELIRLDHDAWFRYRPTIIDALPGLRSRIRKLALLSNMNYEGAARVRDTLPRVELFDHLTLSCELRLMKPDAAIYESCLEGLGVQPGECLFVDDSQKNVEGAHAVGMHSFRFIDEEQFFGELETFYELTR